MQPVDQTVFGERGTCLQAAVASILELTLDDVPDFHIGAANPIQQDQNYKKFMLSLGFYVYERYFLTPGFEAAAIPIFHIAVGKSPRGMSHAVVYFNGALVHDPHPSRAGILRVEEINLFVPVDPSQKLR